MRILQLFIILLLTSCVEEIEFSAPEEVGVLVVDGFFATGSEPSEVKLLRTDVLGKRVFPPETGASIIIFDDTGKQESYVEIAEGLYRSPGQQVWGQVDRSYHIEIVLANGSRYASLPERIRRVPAIDKLSFELTSEYVLVDEVKEQEKPFFNLFVEGSVLGDPQDTYLQWSVEFVYAVSEIVCGPLHAPKTCFIEPPINPNEIFLLDGSPLAPGAKFRVQVAHQELDASFGQTASFYVTQKAITQQAFQYWNHVDQVVNAVGSIFDAPPASIPGNIRNVDDPTEQVLGYFSAFDVQKKLALITAADLGERRQLPLCGIAGLPPEPLPAACCRCQILDFSSTQRPPYWPR